MFVMVLMTKKWHVCDGVNDQRSGMFVMMLMTRELHVCDDVDDRE